VDTTLISFDKLRERFGVTVSRDTLRLHCREGKFPPPINLGRKVFWKVSEVEKFLSSRKPQPVKRQRAP
jgi:predicted DNA-binding transcriptional regulator AlpA